MQSLSITINIDEDPWIDLAELSRVGKVRTAMAHEAGQIRVGGLPRGMESGATAVEILIPLPDGTVVLTETSLKLFLAAADVLRARYPNG